MATGRLRLAAGADGPAAAGLVVRTAFGFVVRVGERLPAARFGGVARLTGFFGVFARFGVALARLGAARPFRGFRPVFLEAAPAARREGVEELRFGRLARPPVGRFLAMSV